MNLHLKRFKSDENGTFGILDSIDAGGNPALLCYTLEPPFDDNITDMSCINTGIYQAIAHDTEAHPKVWELENVPGRSGILIHEGNTIHNTEGCILVGDSIGTVHGLPAVMNSVVTLEKLRSMLPAEGFTITISNNYATNG